MKTGRRRLHAAGLGALTAAALVLSGGGAVAGEPGPAASEGTIRHADVAGAIEGRYIVALKGEASIQAGTQAQVQAQAESLAEAYGGTVDLVYSAAFRGFSLSATEAQAKRLTADPEVRYVEADGIAKATGTQQNPPSWGLDRIDGALDDGYTYPNEGQGVTAYVLDTGVDMDHPQFEGRATSGYDFIDDDPDASDCQGHGTHVAGTVGSRDYGVAKSVDIVSVRVLNCQGTGQWSQIIGGIDWVTQNASGPSIGNMSIGGGANSSVDNAVEGALDTGVQFAIAAGNASENACNTSPARVPGAITLGATTRSDSRASYSNYGSCLDLFAPGSNITSTRNGGGSTQMSGTSMATPHTAGAAALYLSAHPDASPQQVRDAIVGAAESGVVGNPGSGSPNLLLNVNGLVDGEPGPDPEPEPGEPAAEFTAQCGWQAGCTFDAGQSTGGSSYAWDFGDGATGTGKTVQHTYTGGGTFTVTLTVENEAGQSDTATRDLQCYDFGDSALCFTG